MKTSEAIDLLAGALAKAQAEISGAAKDATNPHFRSQYATLASVWEAWQKVGPANDLALMQVTAVEDTRTVLVTRLAHKSGQWIEGIYPIRPVKDDPQGMGSALTYARRYALSAMVGIAPEDDDGNEASKDRTAPAKPRQDPPATQTAAPPPAPPKPDGRTKEQRAKAWVEESKALFAKMLVADEVDEYCQQNADRLDSLAKNYPELDAEFTQAVRDAINSKPSNLQAA